MLYAIAVVIALICDQALKYWTTANIEVNVGIKPLIPGFLHLTHIHNTGAAFSFLQGARWLFVVLCVIFVLVVTWLLVKNIISTPGARWAAVFVMAGALGNCIDRILSDYVVDMLEFEFIRFPVFNLADCFITVGAIAFCVFLLAEKPAGAAETAPAEAAPVPAKEAAQVSEKREAKAEAKPAAKSDAKPELKNPPKNTPKSTSGNQKRGKKKARKKDYARTPYVTPTPAPRPPEPPPIDPVSPFAEWEDPPAEKEIAVQSVDSAQTDAATPAEAAGAPAESGEKK